ncbi:MAG: hypothetical protein JWM74_3921 [Myxococcaceae bacterium]|nr:hypothetical protein [Myxococcaceae bacterium]
MHRIDRFDARAVTWFLRLYGLALVVDVVTEIAAGVWHVHTGRFYPWRNLGIVPLYPASVLALEWTLRAGAGLALVAGATRATIVAAAVRVAALVLFVAVLERYSNHGVLLFLVAFFLTLAPPDVGSPDFRDRAHPALGLVRAQLVIVYVFSALNKLTHGFGSGRSLVHLLGGAVSTSPSSFSPVLATALSLLVIATELAIPVVLVYRPRAGIALVVAMHVAFALLVPGVISFGIAMSALAVLFAGRPRSSP